MGALFNKKRISDTHIELVVLEDIGKPVLKSIELNQL